MDKQRNLNNLNALGNIKIDENKKYAVFSINTKVYPLDVIYPAAYMMMDKAYILLDGDPSVQIDIEIRPKKGQGVEKAVFEFNNELLNYAVYKQQSEKNKSFREAILQRALLTNVPEQEKKDGEKNNQAE